jgi:GNAT superfamily N-acetyltransferase
MRPEGEQRWSAHRKQVIITAVTTPSGEPTTGNYDRNIVFADCTKLNQGSFTVLYRRVLEPAFPPSELEGLHTLMCAYLSGGPGFLSLVALRGSEPVGVALGEFHAPSGILMLGYLAVRDDQRGLGVGTALLERALPSWRTAVNPIAVLAEVEDPQSHSKSQYGDPAARLRFYERFGSQVIPVQYFQPRLAPELPRVHGMFLICLDRGLNSISADAVAKFLDNYIAVCEGKPADSSDAEYLKLNGQLRSWGDNVPLWPLPKGSEIPSAKALRSNNVSNRH